MLTLQLTKLQIFQNFDSRSPPTGQARTLVPTACTLAVCSLRPTLILRWQLDFLAKLLRSEEAPESWGLP